MQFKDVLGGANVYPYGMEFDADSKVEMTEVARDWNAFKML